MNDATKVSALALRAELAEAAQVCASDATRAFTATSCFLRFAISVLLVRGDQQTSDRSFRHCPIFGGSSHTGNDFATKR